MNSKELIAYLLNNKKFKGEVHVTVGEVVCKWDDNSIDLEEIDQIKEDTGHDFYILEYNFCFSLKEGDDFGI